MLGRFGFCGSGTVSKVGAIKILIAQPTNGYFLGCGHAH